MFEKYKFRKYDKKYPELFKKEKTKLKRILPKAKIEHIGSTSIKGLGGKGIIDILIGVNKNKIKNTISILKKAGYIFKTEAGSKDRKFFEKDYIHKGKTRRFHIQLTYYNSKVWKEAIKFRECLRKDKKLRDEYIILKKKAVRLKKRGKEYRRFKNKFFKKVLCLKI